MITKTRLQFLAALFLVALPFLGIPAWLDTVLVSALGVFIALTTFLTARERRLKTRSANMIDAPKEVDVAVAFEQRPTEVKAEKPKRVRRRIVKKPIVQGMPTEEERVMPDASEENMEKEEDVMETMPVETPLEPQPVEETYNNEPVPSPIDPDTVIKKVSRRRVKAPVFVSESEELE